MVVDSRLSHVESGPNDHRKDAPPFNLPCAPYRSTGFVNHQLFGWRPLVRLDFFVI